MEPSAEDCELSFSEGEYEEGDENFIQCICSGRKFDRREIFCDGLCASWYHASCMKLTKKQHL